MTAFTPGSGGSVPSDATTLEMAIIWIFEEARRLQPKSEYILEPGSPAVPACQTSIAYVQNYGTRFTGVAYVPTSDNYLNESGKHWTKTRDGLWITADSPSGAVETFAPGTGGSIPSNVTTFPKALIWASQAYYLCNAAKYIVEQPYNPNTGKGGTFTPVAISQPGPTVDHGVLTLCRVSVPVNADWGGSALKIYKNALVASGVSLGSSLTTN